MKLSAVINTRNEAKNITACLKSVLPFVDEIIVVDMESTDETVKLAKQFTKNIWNHKNVEYVEPARNFAISKASGDWVFLIDADEVLPKELGKKLRELIVNSTYSFYRIPRKNLIFNKWIRHTGWWPDYQIRLFEKGAVTWDDEIHSIPITEGKGLDFPAQESQALHHHNYQSIEQFIDRLNRYTNHEMESRMKKGIAFEERHLIEIPVREFLTRFFAWEGYKDGLHGFVLSVLQGFSMFVVELKMWQHAKFQESKQHILDTDLLNMHKYTKEYKYWYFLKKSQESTDPISKLWYKARSKFSI